MDQDLLDDGKVCYDIRYLSGCISPFYFCCHY
jgi:hypothetical protein